MQQEVRRSGRSPEQGATADPGGNETDRSRLGGSFHAGCDSAQGHSESRHAGGPESSASCAESCGTSASGERRSLLAGTVLGLILCYRKLISPWLPDCCRFEPSCSAYGLQAVQTHGAVKGSLLTVWRILRCNPFSKGGYDPVPPRGAWKNHFGTPGKDSSNEIR